MTTLPVVHLLRARGGRGSADAPNLFVLDRIPQHPPLYLLLESLNADDALYAQIGAACTTAYKTSRSSLTGALLAVVRAAGMAAQQAHTGGAAPCGLSALIINGAEVLLAQVEPAACWLLHDARLLRYPRQSIWLDANSDEQVLRTVDGGLSAPAEPELTRIALQPNDALLLGTTTIARQVGELLIAQALAQPDPTMALHELVPDLPFSAFSIVRAASQPARPGTAESRAAAPLVTSLSPSKAVRGARELPEPSPDNADEPAQPAVTQPATGRKRGTDFTPPDLTPYLKVVAVSLLLILKLIWSGLRALFRLLSRALPDRERAPASHVPQAHRQVMHSSAGEGRVLFSLAVALPVLVFIFVAIFYNQAAAKPRVSDKPQFAGLSGADLVAKANTTYQAALALPADQKRTELLKAAQMLDEALALTPQDASAKDLQTKVQNELDKLSNVTKFFFYPVLYDFGLETGGRPSSVIARGTELYVLDSGLNRLYKFVMNDSKDGLQPNANPVVMRQGDERGNIVISQLADIFWASPGGGRSGAGVLTLTASRQVVDYSPTKGINVVKMGDAPGWQEATLGETFNGNLYVLDAKANRILKFTPTSEDYRNAPSDYVAPSEKVDFAGATDMAIDGFVYVLLADGTLMKFDSGHLIPFDKKGLELPLKKPVALVAQSNSQSLWVADAGNRRIVQFSKSGDFVKQLKPDDASVMNDLRGLAVDEANRRFYFVNGSKLYMGTLQN